MFVKKVQKTFFLSAFVADYVGFWSMPHTHFYQWVRLFDWPHDMLVCGLCKWFNIELPRYGILPAAGQIEQSQPRYKVTNN